jgi:acetyl-CoA carboxylase biotin carboxyl carrier protein
MDQQQIKTFIDAMAASDLAEMEFAQDGWTLRLVRRAADAAQTQTQAQAQAQARAQARARAAGSTQVARAPEPLATGVAIPPLVAPLYGVVHLTPGPGEPAFAVPGQQVNAGQTLCVIEAMKVFNEVRAVQDATIVDVLVESGQEVDADQPLMRFA